MPADPTRIEDRIARSPSLNQSSMGMTVERLRQKCRKLQKENRELREEIDRLKKRAS